jgi:hypothetical protein
MYQRNTNLSLITLVVALFCCISNSSAKAIRAQQITATTDLKAGHHRGFVASNIEYITDGLMSDSPYYEGFIAHANMGVIHLQLDKAYDLASFTLWNDVNLNGRHGINEFNLVFFDANNKLITTLNQSKANGEFNGHRLTLNGEKFVFDHAIKDVKKVDLIINSAFKKEIRLREVAFNVDEINPQDINCSPWTKQSWLESLKLQLHQSNYDIMRFNKNYFDTGIVQYLRALSVINPQIDSLKLQFEYSFQGDKALPIENIGYGSGRIVWNKKGRSTYNAELASLEYNQWIKLSSSIDIVDKKGEKLAVFKRDECVNVVIYYRIKSTTIVDKFKIQISDSKKILETIPIKRKIEAKKQEVNIQATNSIQSKNNYQINLQKDEGELTFVAKEFSVAALNYPAQFDFVNHAVFDDNRDNRILLHTFAYTIPKKCQINKAEFTVKIKNLGGLYNNDSLYFTDKGSNFFAMELWGKGDDVIKIIKVDLLDLKDNKIKNITSARDYLTDGLFSIAIQDDTSVDYVKLDIVLSGDACNLDKPK